jgi:hypothetical protein
MHCFIFKKEHGEYAVVIVPYGASCFLQAPFVTLVTVEINIVVGGQVVKVSAERGILLHAAREESNKKN